MRGYGIWQRGKPRVAGHRSVVARIVTVSGFRTFGLRDFQLKEGGHGDRGEPNRDKSDLEGEIFQGLDAYSSLDGVIGALQVRVFGTCSEVCVARIHLLVWLGLGIIVVR